MTGPAAPFIYVEHTSNRSWFATVTFIVCDAEEDPFSVTWDAATLACLRTAGRTYFALSAGTLERLERVTQDCREVKSAWGQYCADPDAIRFIKRCRHYLTPRWGQPPRVEITDRMGNSIEVDGYQLRRTTCGE